MSEFKKRRVVVVGGSGDIGRAIVKGFLDAGAEVLVVDRTFESLSGDEYQEVKRCDVDLSDVHSAVSGLRAALDEWKECHALVYAAALNLHKDMDTMDIDTWTKVQSVNVTGAFFLAREAATYMPDRHGRVVLVSSCSAALAYPGFPDYIVSKGAIEALGRSLAVELAPRGITVNTIAPGTTRTRMTKSLWEDADKLTAHQATIPLGRIAEPADHVGPTMFLCSDAARYITGTVLPVDGGLRILQADFINLKLRNGTHAEDTPQ